MILYATLLFYLLLVLVSAVFLWRKSAGTSHTPGAFAFPMKNFLLFGPHKAKISRFVTHYECPECGYETEDHRVHCPRCRAEGKSVRLEAHTLIFQP